MDDDGLLEDMNFDAELDGFFAGTGGTVNLQPHPTSLGRTFEEPSAAPEPEAKAGVGGAAATATAVVGAVASALLAGRLSGMLGGAVGSAAVPAALQPVKERAGQLLSRLQPWRQFIFPLSVPSASEGCSRLTANIYHFQTNYAVLFVAQLVLAILLQPSALLCIVGTVVVWMVFLRKNSDPEWKPEIGGTQLGPMQRWLLLAALTAVVLLFVAGSTIFNSALLYVFFAASHGILHDPSAKAVPGPGFDPVAV